MPDAKELIKNARRRETTYRLCLRGDLLAEHEALESELARITGQGGWTASSLADVSPVVDLAQQIEALEAEMREQTVTLRFRALRRVEWEALVAEHPGREDKQEAFNVETFAAPLVRACLYDPELSASEFDEFWDEALNHEQRDEVFGAAWAANTEASNVPFSERASVVTRWREQNSRQPEPGASPEASS